MGLGAQALHLCRKKRLHPAQSLCSVRPVGRRGYLSVSDSCRTCWSSASSSWSRSSRSSSSLADSSMASCKSLSKRLLSPGLLEHRPSALVSRLSWMALGWKTRKKRDGHYYHHHGGDGNHAPYLRTKCTPCQALYVHDALQSHGTGAVGAKSRWETAQTRDGAAK